MKPVIPEEGFAVKAVKHGRRFIDLTGQRFGRLIVIAYYGKSKRGMSKWLCRCDCGREIVAYAGNLKRPNHTTSCGCAQAEITEKRSLKHGHNRRGRRSVEYSAWAGSGQRTNNPNSPVAKWYFEKGVRRCSGLSNFSTWIKVLGSRPSNAHSVDRKDNGGGYTCGTCHECQENSWPMNLRWATKIEQMNNKDNNRRLEYRGDTHTIAEWSRILNKNHDSIRSGLNNGLSDKDALERSKDIC